VHVSGLKTERPILVEPEELEGIQLVVLKAELGSVRTLLQRKTVGHLEAVVVLDVLPEEADRSPCADRGRNRRQLRIGNARPLLAGVLEAKVIRIAAEEAGQLSDACVCAVLLRAVIGERAVDRRQDGGPGRGAIECFVAAVAVAQVQAMVVAELIVYLAQQRDGIVGLLVRGFLREEEINRFLAAAGVSGGFA